MSAARSHPSDRSAAPRRAAWIAALVLGVVYVATAARRVTFWDAGEFLAAFHTLGIPHPPGTPIFVLLGAVASRFGAALGPVLPASLLSAATTVAACAIGAALVARWTRDTWMGVAGAICAGATSSVWLNATEPEVYALSLCLAACMLLAAERAEPGWRDRGDRHVLLFAYLCGLAVPLHLSALVAAPAAAVRASLADDALDVRRLARMSGLLVTAAGIGTMSVAVTLAGVALTLGAAALDGRVLRACGELAAVAVAASAVVVLLVRARHEPVLDQGTPATWRALVDVVARRQYAVAPLWPRRAPWWLQIGNLGQWADWQFALGLHDDVTGSFRRTPITLGFVALGAYGARAIRAASRRAWYTTLALFLAGSLGVVAYLNLRVGPSFGVGVVAADALHEARERDYFFVLAFWTWGLWAGVGAVALARRLAPAAAPLGVAIAALPIALNWRAVDRRREPDASLPGAYARALLASAPPRAVLLLAGDNDTYPLWFAQLAEGARPDVTPITVPLLGAAWYRAEVARRHGMSGPDASTRWLGEAATVRRIADAAARADRPLAVANGLPDSLRSAIGGAWTLAGVVWVRGTGAGVSVDTGVTARIASGVAPAIRADVGPGTDGSAAWAQRLLRCPARALAAAREGAVASLDAICNPK